MSMHKLTGSALAYWLAEHRLQNPNQNFLFITPGSAEGLLLKQDLEFFLKRESVLFFPPLDPLPYSGIFASPDTLAARMAVLHALLEKKPFLLVAPWTALLRGTLPPDCFQSFQKHLSVNASIDRDALIPWLLEAGYQREAVVESPGDFSLRGSIVDCFPPQYSNPVRFEWDGDQLVSMRFFDPVAQTSLGKVEAVTLIGAEEILYSKENLERGLGQLKKGCEEKEVAAPLRREMVERFQARQPFAGRETFLPLFYEKPATLLDYLPPSTHLVLPDLFLMSEAAKKLFLDLNELHQHSKSLERLIPVSHLFFGHETLTSLLAPFQTMVPAGTIEGSASLKSRWSIQQLKNWLKQGLKVRLVCHTEIQAQRLKDLLIHQEVPPLPIEIGNLSQGFYWVEKNLLVLTEEEIFGHKTFRKTKPLRKIASFASFAEIREGDLLVHEDYGICRYHHLKHLAIQGVHGDFLELQFFGKDRLYLPVYRLHAVGRYIGANPEGVTLDPLGGIRWRKMKEKAGAEAMRLASELLKIHAQRSGHPGVSYSPADTLDEEFASHFPFDETPDQARAIEEVLKDMEEVRPMDRLVCGDVGFGKTEVAMRAAFKVVSSGRQVAFLVPTTILALQHFENFQERFSKMAVSVEMLSRFRSIKEQKATLAKLAAGQVDIVIGTHRLLAEDVIFKKMGLLILDEEHRFGVKQKEKIKKWRPTVDVLTLSATPIPRTLYMSMVGIKDLSLIQTPPVDRLSVRTYVAKWEDSVIRHAIRLELERGGQVFFVHNRVATIDVVFRRIEKLFPEAKIAIAHGQMKEQDLEKVMVAFLHRKIDILVTTAIIESGIDVPSANTMLINRADMFGLAQLYQLRGRVGRSDRQAYCYLLIPDDTVLTTDAKERLEALTRYSELGAGFQIASHDLEMRGAGNLLGASQSGFMEEIGYEMYTRLLSQAIRRLKGEGVEEVSDVEIQLKIPAYIPDHYVSESRLRMELYKRMSHLSDEAQIRAFALEMSDRFGPIPDFLQNLLGILEIKCLALRLKMKTVMFDAKKFPALKKPPEIIAHVKNILRHLL